MEKKKYTAPEIEVVLLDSEISLALESLPPTGPDEGFNAISTLNSQDPYKSIS